MGASMVKWTTRNPCLVFSEVIQNHIVTLNFVTKRY